MEDKEAFNSKETPTKKARRVCHYNVDWESHFVWLNKCDEDNTKGYCKLCKNSFTVAYDGLKAVTHNAEAKKHKECESAAAMSHRMKSFFTPKRSAQSEKVGIAELTEIYHSIKHHISYVADGGPPFHKDYNSNLYTDPVVVYKQRNFWECLSPHRKRVTHFPRLEEGNVPINTSCFVRVRGATMTQGPSESVQEFAARINKLGTQIFQSGNSAQNTAVRNANDQLLQSRFISGLKMKYAGLFSPRDPLNLEESINAALIEEQNTKLNQIASEEIRLVDTDRRNVGRDRGTNALPVTSPPRNAASEYSSSSSPRPGGRHVHFRESTLRDNYAAPRHSKEKWRLVLDFRKLNEITVTQDFVIPTLDDILHEISGSNYFSASDMKSAFNQIPLHFADRHKTAFSTPDGDKYQFNRLCFGLKNSPKAFQSIAQEVLADLLHHGALVYIDDIILFTKTIDEHFELLGRKFKVFTDHKPLAGFLSNKNPSSKILRWKLALEEFNYDIHYIRGSLNSVADHLSRYINNITIALPDSKDLINMQREDSVLSTIIQKIDQNDVSPQISNYFINGEGLLCHLSKRPSRSPRSNTTRKQVCIPHCLKAKILESVHSEYGGHLKFFKTYHRLSENFFWHNMYKDTKNFVRSCTICLSRKTPLKSRLHPINLLNKVLNQEKRVIWIFSVP
ncbi:retrovirus-related Pol polyprotein from transposon 17.6 [Trichonephila clavipes]|nr:retrovirus-related Pol polyprotein from transposon 17.6 [Trichonephila clavipes]